MQDTISITEISESTPKSFLTEWDTVGVQTNNITYHNHMYRGRCPMKHVVDV
jgi:hypothetical protein